MESQKKKIERCLKVHFIKMRDPHYFPPSHVLFFFTQDEIKIFDVFKLKEIDSLKVSIPYDGIVTITQDKIIFIDEKPNDLLKIYDMKQKEMITQKSLHSDVLRLFTLSNSDYLVIIYEKKN